MEKGQRVVEYTLLKKLCYKERKMKMHKKLKTMGLAFFIGIFLSFSTLAFAQVIISNQKSFSDANNLHSYINYCQITDSPRLIGSATMRTQNLENVPSNYMRLSAYVYKSDGTCVRYTTWKTNTTSTYILDSGATDYYFLGGNFYCKGLSQVYNGYNYDSAWSYATAPNISI